MKKIFFLFIALFSMFFGNSQELLPYVENYTKAEYVGDNQIWNISQGNDGAMYFANNRFLLRYNGVVWEKYTLPNKTIIRSVFIDEDKIYTGSYTEFGFWQRKSGKMVYHSLSKNKDLFQGTSNNEEIWKIFKVDNAIYFQSFNELFIYDFTSIKKVRIPFQISYCFHVDHKIYVASVKEGVYLYENNQFKKIEKWTILEDKVIHAIEKHNNKLYIFTQKDGVFVENKGALEVLDLVLNQKLKDESIITAKSINDSTLVIGTALKGIYIVNSKTKKASNINRSNALKNNSVLTIATDKENDLWLGLDNGIAHVEINSPITIFSDNSGFLGSVYTLYPKEKGYLLGTNHGVFEWQNNEIKTIPNSQGQVWDIQKINNQYIIGHNDGTFVYQNNTYQKGNDISGGWKLFKSDIDNKYYQSNYSGIVIYDNPMQLSKYKRVSNVTKPIKNMAQNKPNELWAVDNYRSLFKITFSKDFTTNTVENVTQKNGLYNDFGVKIFKFKNEILFYTDGIWYQNNSITDKLEKNNIFNENFNAISDIIPIDETSFIVLKDNFFYLISYRENTFYWNIIPQKYYEGKIINQDTKALKVNQSILLNLDDGFLLYDRSRDKPKAYDVTIEGFYQNQWLTKNTEIQYNQTVALHLLSEYYGFNRQKLFYTLNNEKEYESVEKSKIILNNLSSGKQLIEVYYFDGNQYQKITEYQFHVKKPWYISFWMMLVYVLILSIIFYLYYKWNKIRYLEKLKLKEEELKYHNQIEQLEKEAANKLKIQEYEKHILEIQVQTKASEVAGKSLSIAKQSEMIESIETILADENDLSQMKSKIKKSIKNNSINKNEWQIFEKNLMKSHEDFVHNLTQKYTNLSSKDIKLCIYLRMNLASKEIAPLMNISYRGVELHRYRLRKKLGLSKEENLTHFVINI